MKAATVSTLPTCEICGSRPGVVPDRVLGCVCLLCFEAAAAKLNPDTDAALVAPLATKGQP